MPHDRVIVVEGKKFYVFANFLSNFSEFFQIMFTSDFKEKEQQEIVIEEILADDFHQFLKSIQTIPKYNREINSFIKDSNFFPILHCSRRFMAPQVTAMCEDFTIDHFEIFDKLDLIIMAFEYNLEILKDFIIKQLTGSSLEEEQEKCYYCDVRPKKKPLGPLNKSSYLVQNRAKIASLPTEIQVYLLNSLLNNDAKSN